MLRTNAKLTHALVKALWQKTWPEAAGQVYCETIRTSVGSAKYVAKAIGDERKDNPLPPTTPDAWPTIPAATWPAKAKDMWQLLVKRLVSGRRGWRHSLYWV